MRALLAIDGSRESAVAVDTAASLAWPAGASLEVVTVVPSAVELLGGPWMVPARSVVPDVRERLLVESRRLIDEAADLIRRPGLDVVTSVLHGRAASAITDEATRTGADLIIVGARGHGTLERMLIGSVSAEVVDQAHCPVLVARAPTAWRVLVATDGSPDAELAVEFVAGAGLFRYASACVVNVIDVPAAWWLGVGDTAAVADAYASAAKDAEAHGRQVTGDGVRRLRDAGVEAEEVVREGPAPAEIVAQATAWNADLIVVGTRGFGLLRRLIVGSTARTLVQHAPVSVLVVRPTSAAPRTRTRSVGHSVPTAVTSGTAGVRGLQRR